MLEHFYTFVLTRQPPLAESKAGACFIEVVDVLDQKSPQKLLVLSHSCLALVQVDSSTGDFAYKSVLGYPLILSAVQTEDGTLSLVHSAAAEQLQLRANNAAVDGKKALALIKARRAFHGRLVPGLLGLSGLAGLFGDFEIERAVVRQKSRLDEFYKATRVEQVSFPAPCKEDEQKGKVQRTKPTLGKSFVLAASKVSALQAEVMAQAKAKSTVVTKDVEDKAVSAESGEDKCHGKEEREKGVKERENKSEPRYLIHLQGLGATHTSPVTIRLKAHLTL